MSTLRNLSDQDVQPAAPRDLGDTASSAVVNLDARRGRPAWEREIVATLCRYLELSPNWDSYGGKPLRHDAGMFALQVLNGIMNESIPVPAIVPVSSGGVQFEWHQNGLDIEFYVAAPYECELSVYDHSSDEPPKTTPLKADFSALSEQVRRLVDFNRHLRTHAHAS
jgi:hypothetical protein